MKGRWSLLGYVVGREDGADTQCLHQIPWKNCPRSWAARVRVWERREHGQQKAEPEASTGSG